MDVGCTVSGDFQPQPWLHNIMWFQPYYPIFPKNHPPPAQMLQCKGALHLYIYMPSKGSPICPSTAYEGAQTLHLRLNWMWDAVSRGL